MHREIVSSLVVPAALIALLASASSAWQEGAGMPSSPPSALSDDHARLRADARKAEEAGGATAQAARDLEALLSAHLDALDSTAAPLLGLLPTLASGVVTQEMLPAIDAAADLRARMPALEDERDRLAQAADRLRQTAVSEGQPDAAALADRVLADVRLEEQVLLPAALVARTTSQQSLAALPEGVAPAISQDVSGVRRSIAAAAGAVAAADGDLSQVTNYLSALDRERIGNYAAQYYPDLAAAAGQFARAWRARYGSDFAIADAPGVLGERFLTISSGRAVASQGAGAWPVSPSPGVPPQRFVSFGPTQRDYARHPAGGLRARAGGLHSRLRAAADDRLARRGDPRQLEDRHPRRRRRPAPQERAGLAAEGHGGESPLAGRPRRGRRIAAERAMMALYGVYSPILHTAARRRWARRHTDAQARRLRGTILSPTLSLSAADRARPSSRRAKSTLGNHDMPEDDFPEESEESAGENGAGKQRTAIWAAFGGVVLLAAAGLAIYFYVTRNSITTEDAFVEARVVAIAPLAAGRATAVRVGANQFVEAGAALAQIDSSGARETLTAPAGGYVANKSVERGSYVAAGETLMSIVPPEVWVVPTTRRPNSPTCARPARGDLRRRLPDRFPRRVEASRRARAAVSACCRRRTPRATTSRSSSACRSRSSSTPARPATTFLVPGMSAVVTVDISSGRRATAPTCRSVAGGVAAPT